MHKVTESHWRTPQWRGESRDKPQRARGVHINSGIPNHAVSLAATALGGNAWERAGQIWFDVLTGGELGSKANFSDLATLTVAQVRTAYGEGGELQAVAKAWEQVGVPTT